MEEVSLTETESRYFGDLFLCCDVEKTGKIPMLKATELYRSANLSNDVLGEITSLAGIPDAALHISRAQFYSCLKLIAAHQAAMPLRQELIAASLQLPLPRFSWKDSPSAAAGAVDDTAAVAAVAASGAGLHHQSNGLNALPPPPVADRRNSLPRRADWQESGVVVGAAAGSRRNSTVTQQQQQLQEAAVNSDVPSTDSEVEQNESSCGGEGGGAGGGTGSSGHEMHRRRGGSPEAWSTNSDSPTPTNSVAERPWKDTLWHGLLGDEHRQLLGTEEESSDRHSSDDDNESDLETVYQITPEQREYYYKQFKAVQHDVNGLLSGQVARIFFEKSRIPVEELRHIWQLCDVTRDGALSLAEFTAAMHLVVLRRNNIPLPNVLPACLYPSMLQPPQEPPEADLLHLNDDEDEDNTDNTIIGAANTAVTAAGGGRLANDKNVMNLSTLSTSSQNSTSSRQGVAAASASLTPPLVKNRSISNSPNVEPNTTPPVLPAAALVKPKDRALWTTDVPPTQWTKFTESPTSNVSSPGPKPVNFDMQRTAQAVVSDPQILHPVPLRVTPVANASSVDKPNYEAHESVALRENSPKQQVVPSHVSAVNAATVATEAAIATPNASNSTPHHRDSLQNNDLRGIQRPQAKKLPAKNIGALPPPPQRESSIGSVGGGGGGGAGNLSFDGGSDMPIPTVSANLQQNHQSQQQHHHQQPQPPPIALAGGKKEPPPLPPPPPHRHGRSSSLDLNKFKMNAPAGQQPEPDQSPEQQQHSLPSTQTSSVAPVAPPPTRLSLQSNQRVSAFEVYRKPNTPRNSQSPTSLAAPLQQTATADAHHPQPTQPPPPAPAPFGAVGAAAIANAATAGVGAASALPNAEQYERRVNAISETLRHVSFKPDNSMPDILRHLREQNNLLLHLCNDLSDELLTVQTRKEEMRLKLEMTASDMAATAAAAAAVPTTAIVLRTGSSISAPVTANVTGGSGSSGVHSNV